MLRDLRQDVRAFWRYAAGAAAGAGIGAEQLAAAFVGRARDGTPLVQHTDQNAFRYGGDPEGLRCPFGAHIRRANPRNEDYARRPNGAIGTILADARVRPARAARGPDVAGALSPDRTARSRVRRGIDA